MRPTAATATSSVILFHQGVQTRRSRRLDKSTGGESVQGDRNPGREARKFASQDPCAVLTEDPSCTTVHPSQRQAPPFPLPASLDFTCGILFETGKIRFGSESPPKLGAGKNADLAGRHADAASADSCPGVCGSQRVDPCSFPAYIFPEMLTTRAPGVRLVDLARIPPRSCRSRPTSHEQKAHGPLSTPPFVSPPLHVCGWRERRCGG